MSVASLVIFTALVVGNYAYLENLAANVVIQDNSNFEPMVAFICNKTAMHLTAEGWKADHFTDCLRTEIEIVTYCQKMYPGQKISMVMQANKKETIKHWCRMGVKHCKKHHTHSVTPFKCIVGEYKSKALLVPEHCVFHHLHNKQKGQSCAKVHQWTQKSKHWCGNQGFRVDSKAMLRPCNHMTYTGIEFVCCPLKNKAVKHHKVVPKKGIKKVTQQHKKEGNRQSDFYGTYLHENGKQRYLKEHEMYIEAERSFQKHQHNKVTKMMTQWSAARRHVEEMTKSDPKGAKKLNQEITKRYERVYLAMEQESHSEKRQLVAVHQQHVHANLNARKRKALDHYMYQLQKKKPDPSKILETLEHFIRAEEKDRRHTINHYQHLMDTDAKEADRIRDHLVKHLKNCDTRINQTINMLDRVSKFSKKIKEHARNFVATFRSTDLKIIQMLIHPKPHLVKVKVSNNNILTKYKEEFEHKEKIPVHFLKTENREKIPVHIAQGPPVSKKIDVFKVKSKHFDSETHEDEHKYMKVMVGRPAADVHSNKLSVSENDVHHDQVIQTKVASKASGNTVAGIVMGCVAVIVIIVFAIVIVKKKQGRTPLNHGFIEVDQVSPEEKHVANMQMNGYENPTYRYFEDQTA